MQGHDYLFGGKGKDTLWGGAGKDRLFGNMGKDTLMGGIKKDRLFGGFGKDGVSRCMDVLVVDGCSTKAALICSQMQFWWQAKDVIG